MNYTQTGEQEGYTKESIDKAVGFIEWEKFRTNDLPMGQGMFLDKAIKEYKIPVKGIKEMSLHGTVHNLEGFDAWFYALQVQYKNGIANLYFADDGVSGCVIASELKEEVN